MNTPVVRVKGIPLPLSDGNTYVFPPLALGALEQLQERIASFTGEITDPKTISTAIDVCHASLKRNYPEITREDCGELVGLENMLDIYAAAMDVSGLRRKALEAAENQAGADDAAGETTPG